MFDRRYYLQIRHADLPGGVLDIYGDTAEPSLGLRFGVRLTPALSLQGGFVEVSGLTKDHVDLLTAVKRYNMADERMASNSIVLAVGYRENGVESPLYPILSGNILEAIPGPNPNRSIRIQVYASSIVNAQIKGNDTILQDSLRPLQETIEEKNRGKVLLTKWVNEAASALNKMFEDNDFPQPYKIILKKSLVEGTEWYYIKSAPYPKTVKEFKEKMSALGIPFESSYSVREVEASGSMKMLNNTGYIGVGGLLGAFSQADQKKEIFETITVGESTTKDVPEAYIRYISQENGMIGMPTSTELGVSVQTILKDPILPGYYAHLSSTMFSKLSSKSKKWEGEGVYYIQDVTYTGDFLGNDWKQTLNLVGQAKEVVGGDGRIMA